MDDFLDSFFSSSSSWTDMNAMEKPSWVGSGPINTSGLLPNSMEVYERDEKNSNRSANHPSSHIMDTLPTQVTSVLVGGESTYGLNKGFIPGAAPHQQVSPDHEIKPFLDRVMNGSSPKLHPITGGLANSPRVLPESGSSGSNDGEPFGLQKFLRDPHSLPSIPQLWSTPSYGALSSQSPVIGQDNIQGFGLQGEHVDNDAKVLGTRYIRDDTVLELDKLRAPMSINDQEELQSHNLSSPHITMAKTAGIPSLSQMPQLHENIPIQHYSSSASFSQLQSAPATATGGCNGTGKPRVRARRGQATDPHSIAERLRREKITERMKNLQELVPNSNKTDKASTLDEIIEYVKFLQLQVKVLSMSRLGAAGAVVPLITDGQAEGSNGLLLAPSTGQGADLSESSENIAFEQEVVKLMESNVTMAMQFLQSKGLCLMPIALAAAISGANSSSNERKKPGLTHGIVPHNNSEGIRVNGYNDPSGKQEEVESIPCITREL